MRKSVTITIEAEGRDKGRTFLLEEMPASKFEKFLYRLAFVCAHAGVDVDLNLLSAGGKNGFLRMMLEAMPRMAWGEFEPLLDEIFSCVRIVPQTGLARALVENDIEEFATRMDLRGEVIELHMGFLGAVAPSPTASASSEGNGSRITRTSSPALEL